MTPEAAVKIPRLSVGLPVYNGERYLDVAIQSILDQTYTDFELIICDNASTDRTAEIVFAHAARDARVRYHRNDSNIGGGRNANLTFTLARGELFRWAAYDDVLDPDLFERCIAILDRDPGVVLCDSVVSLIDSSGREIGQVRRPTSAEQSPRALFRYVASFDHDCEATYGIMRAGVLAKTGLHRPYTDSDRTLLVHMALLGRFAQIPEPLFRRRIHEEASTRVHPEWRGRMIWFGEEYRDKLTLPFWRQLRHYTRIVISAPIEPGMRLWCFGYMIRWPFRYRRWRSLVKDVVLAARHLGRRAERFITRPPARDRTARLTSVHNQDANW
jgi:glycosyltransferase involved in cell wall biosynthesis